MKSTQLALLFEAGCAGAREAVASSGTAMNFIKKGRNAWIRFVQLKTIGYSDLETAIWLGGFNATMLNKVVMDYAALEAKSLPTLKELQ